MSVRLKVATEIFIHTFLCGSKHLSQSFNKLEFFQWTASNYKLSLLVQRLWHTNASTFRLYRKNTPYSSEYFFPIHFIYGIHISDAGLMIAGDTHHRPLRILPSLLLSHIRFESINNHYLIARSLTIQVHSLELCYVFRFSFNARLTLREKKATKFKLNDFHLPLIYYDI